MSQFQPPPPTYVNPQAYQWPSQPLPQQQSKPPRKSSALWYVALAVIVFSAVVLSYGLGYAVGKDSANPTTQQTATTAHSSPVPTHPPVKSTPPHAPKWTTIQTFSGNGEKTTATFATSGDWKLVWTAQADSASEAFLGITVYSAGDNSLVDDAANATIPAGKKGTDSSDEHTGAGSFYLKIYAGIPWSVQVQELK